MSNKHQVRISNLLEKQKHINFESIEDPTIINYLRLYEVLVDQDLRDMKYYLNDLIDEEASKKRMKEIDEIRAAGGATEAEMIGLKECCDKRYKAVLNGIKRMSKQERYGHTTKVVNPSAGTEEIFNSLREACEEYGLKYNNARAYFSQNKKSKKNKNNTIKYHGLYLTMLD